MRAIYASFIPKDPYHGRYRNRVYMGYGSLQDMQNAPLCVRISMQSRYDVFDTLDPLLACLDRLREATK